MQMEMTVEAVRYRVGATVVKTPFFEPKRKTAHASGVIGLSAYRLIDAYLIGLSDLSSLIGLSDRLIGLSDRAHRSSNCDGTSLQLQLSTNAIATALRGRRFSLDFWSSRAAERYRARRHGVTPKELKDRDGEFARVVVLSALRSSTELRTRELARQLIRSVRSTRTTAALRSRGTPDEFVAKLGQVLAMPVNRSAGCAFRHADTPA